MNGKFSYSNWLLFPLSLIVILIFTNVEVFLVAAEGTNASWYIFLLYYILEFIFLLLSFFWLFPKLCREAFAVPLKLAYLPAWVILAALVSISVRLLIYTLYGRTLSLEEMRFAFTESLYRHAHILFFAILIYVVKLLISHMSRSVRYENLADDYKQQNRKLQSLFWGTQMNPHLMVNVLNAVQANILEKSPESFHLIGELADLHEHLLIQADPESRSTLNDEIVLIKKVIELYRELGKDLSDIEIDITEDAGKVGFQSNLIVPLIENVFKHADFTDESSQPYIKLAANVSSLKLYIKNKVSASAVVQTRKGLGLQNCLRRLEVHYPKKFNLTSVNKEQYYQLLLDINLTNDD